MSGLLLAALVLGVSGHNWVRVCVCVCGVARLCLCSGLVDIVAFARRVQDSRIFVLTSRLVAQLQSLSRTAPSAMTTFPVRRRLADRKAACASDSWPGTRLLLRTTESAGSTELTTR